MHLQLQVVDTYSGTPTATLGNAHTLAELKTINNAISGTIALNDYTVALSGSSADVAAALAGSFAASYTGNATLSDAHTLAQLKTINNATDGTITLNDASVALSGSSADIAAALTGISSYTGTATLTSNHTLAELKTVNNATSGTITLNRLWSSTLTGSTSDLSSISRNVAATYTGNVTLSDANGTGIAAQISLQSKVIQQEQ